MTSSPDRTDAGRFCFGPFTFHPGPQLLLHGKTPVRVGSRALMILLSLVERPGALVDRRALMARAWPDTRVEDSNLKVTVAALRRALGDTLEQPRFIATVNGRGYRFVAPVDHLIDPPAEGTRAAPGRHNLPLATTRIIGRDAAIDTVLRQCGESRLLTIVGPGGIGKTTVAMAVAGAAAPAHAHGAWLVDLTPVTDPALVPATIAAVIGLTVQSQDVTSALLAFLRDRHLLLVIDNCEHLVRAAADIVERIISDAPGVHVLATSREALRIETEAVYRLDPLDTPSGSVALSAADALAFSAIALFVERAARSAGGFALSDANAPVVRDICQALDGIALAIELAATRVSSLGVDGLREALADRFGLLNQGKRTAPARQRTLQATLDWSYRLLTEHERIVLQRLAIFAGTFDLEAAVAVAACGVLGRPAVVDALGSLIAKSLVSVSPAPVTHYRLLESTRAFARDRLAECGAFGRFAMKHAEFLRNELRRAEIALRAALNSDGLLRCTRQIDDVRAALAWAFSSEESRAIGVSLVVEAIPLWSRMSLLEECREWVERVLSTSPLQAAIPEWDRMRLFSAYGSALLYTRGPDPRVEVALLKARQLAESLANPVYLSRILWQLAFYYVYIGQHRSAVAMLGRLESVAAGASNAAALRDSERLKALTLHYMGRHEAAHRHLTGLIADHAAQEKGARLARFQLDLNVTAYNTLAHVQFVMGRPDQARQSAHRALAEAEARGHAISLGTVLAMSAVPIALYRGDYSDAERFLGRLTELVATHGLVIWEPLTGCLRSTMRVVQGDAAGVPGLRHGLERLRKMNFGVRYASFLGLLARGLGVAGQRTEALLTIEDALRWSDCHEDVWCVPELLRVKAGLLRLDGSAASDRAAERLLLQALDMARDQDALSWELRAALDLAELWKSDRRTMDGRRLLSQVYARFHEGFDTSDLRAARALLRTLERRQERSPSVCGNRGTVPQFVAML